MFYSMHFILESEYLRYTTTAGITDTSITSLQWSGSDYVYVLTIRQVHYT